MFDFFFLNKFEFPLLKLVNVSFMFTCVIFLHQMVTRSLNLKSIIAIHGYWNVLSSIKVVISTLIQTNVITICLNNHEFIPLDASSSSQEL